MERTIGMSIRKFRKRRDITQDRLAEILGVSSQAVSKWETNLSTPDVSLLPVIADFFGVSIDELFDRNSTDSYKEIDNLYIEGERLCSNGDESAEGYVRRALTRYPGSFKLMNLMMRILQSLHDPARLREIIDLADRILCRCTDDQIRFSTIQILAFTYKDAGDINRAKELIDKFPASLCGEDLLSIIVEGEERLRLKQVILSRNILRTFLSLRALAVHSKNNSSYDDAVFYIETFEKYLDTFIEDRQYGGWIHNLVDMLLLKAAVYMQWEDSDRALFTLEQICDYVTDNRYLVSTGRSRCFDRLDTYTSEDAGVSVRASVISTIEKEQYNPLRHLDRYQAVKSKLNMNKC